MTAKPTTPVIPADSAGFIAYMKGRWQQLRAVSTGASISFQNTGCNHTASFACAERLKEITGLERYYSTRLGYPTFTVPNTEAAKFLAQAGELVSIALVDMGEEIRGGELVTKPVTIYVIHPSFNLQGTLTGRTRSDVPNESAKPSTVPPVKKKTIRER